MAIKIGRLKGKHNAGSALYVSGDVELDVEEVDGEGNGRDAVTIIQPKSLVEILGLPKEINAKELGNLLIKLQNKSKPEADEIIEKSNVLSKLGGAADIANIATLIFTISTNSNVHKIIEDLLR